MWFRMGSLHKNIQLMLEFPKSPFLVLQFSYYTLMAFVMMLSLIMLSALNKGGGSYIISNTKTDSKKIGALIRSMNFVYPEVAINLPYGHAWNTVVMSDWCSWNLELLNKPQNRICTTVGPSLAAFLEPLVHCRNVASLSLFYRYYFGKCSSELAQLVLIPYSHSRSTSYSDRLHDFSVTIPRCCKDVYDYNFFFTQLVSGILCLENAFL